MDKYFTVNNKSFAYKHEYEPFKITATIDMGQMKKCEMDECLRERKIKIFSLFELKITKKSKLEILPIINDEEFYYFIFEHKYSNVQNLLTGLKKKGIKRVRKNKLKLIKSQLSKIKFSSKTLFNMDKRFSKFFEVKDSISKNPPTKFEDHYYEFLNNIMYFRESISPSRAIDMFIDKFGLIYQKEIMEKRSAIKKALSSCNNNKVSFEILIDGETENILKKKTELFQYFTTSKRIEIYKEKCIDHIWVDGTHSLPKPYSQLINILGLIEVSNKYLFIGCFLTKENLCVGDWNSIFDTIKIDFSFNGVSCDNETALISCLNTRKITIWGDQPHYVRSISKILSNKIRTNLFTVLKYIMKFNERNKIFEKLLDTANDTEHKLITKIKNIYFSKYFQGEFIGILKAGIDYLEYAKLTTSAVEGVNNGLKFKLKAQNSTKTVNRFIKMSLTGTMNKRKKSRFSTIGIKYIYKCIEYPGEDLFKMKPSKQNTSWAKTDNKKKSMKELDNEIIDFKKNYEKESLRTIGTYKKKIEEINLAEINLIKKKNINIKQFKYSMSEDLNRKKIKLRNFAKSNIDVLTDSIITESFGTNEVFKQSYKEIFNEVNDLRKIIKSMREEITCQKKRFDENIIVQNKIKTENIINQNKIKTENIINQKKIEKLELIIKNFRLKKKFKSN